MIKTTGFLPAFGNKPTHIVGRQAITADFADGLTQSIGHQNRATLLVGQRGTGKTALLLAFAEIAAKQGYVCARVVASEDMLLEIIQTIQINGSEYVSESKTKVKGFSTGALGFSFGLTFTEKTEAQYGFRVKLGMLCDKLKAFGKGIAILVDEVQSNTPEMRSLATTYQHLVGEGKDVVIAMAGLPSSLSAVLNDDILTFLNRARKVYLEPLPYGEVGACYALEFRKQGKTITADNLEKAALATKGYPYLLQLIGYYVLKYAEETDTITDQIVDLAVRSSKREMVDNIFAATLKPLSQRDMDFLRAMAKDVDESKMSDIIKRIDASQSYAQKYRTRLIGAGIIAPVRRGVISIVVPYLGEYLRKEF